MAIKSFVKKRPSWDSYFLSLAQHVKSRSNCLRLEVGAVLVQGRHIIATGYNGTPAGVKNCFEGGCERCLHRDHGRLAAGERKDLCICIHAEHNAILQSSYHGASTHGAILYSTTAPCLQCAKALINAGIASVVYESDHTENLGLKLLTSSGIAVKKFTK